MLWLLKQLSIVIHNRERFAITNASYCMVGDMMLNFQRNFFFLIHLPSDIPLNTKHSTYHLKHVES